MPRLSDDNLIWIDLEMTGVAIHQPDSILDRMDEWNTSHHTSSGLVDRVRSSEYSAQKAEQITLDFLAQWVPAGISPMSGNSICQDRRFMARHMPGLENYFHYRNLDVSTIKILANRWAPQVSAGFKKDSQHLALEDIRDSINELRYYREHFFLDFS